MQALSSCEESSVKPSGRPTAGLPKCGKPSLQTLPNFEESSVRPSERPTAGVKTLPSLSSKETTNMHRHQKCKKK